MSSNLTLSASFALACIGLISSSIARASDSDAASLYRAALAQVRAIEQPAFLTYRTSIPAGTGTLSVTVDDIGEAELAIVAGESQPQSWMVAYRDADGRSSIAAPNGTHAISHLAIFDPSWRGVLTWLRHGLGASIVATPAPSAAPSPVASAQTIPPVIAIVSAIGEGAYAVSDAGVQRCPDGTPGRAIATKPRSDALSHPLVEATVNEATQRFCAMRFHEHLVAPSVAFDLDVELQFGTVGKYYLVTGGQLNGAVRPYRRPGWFRIDTSFRYEQFTFPERLPNALFEPTAHRSATATAPACRRVADPAQRPETQYRRS